MSATKKQIRANRQNAKKSTGPRSMEAKLAVRNNAVTYGLFARDVVINSPKLKENGADFDLLMDSLLNELRPQTGLQYYLVQKVADALWRSRRAVRAETATVTQQIDNVDGDLKLRDTFLRVVSQIDGSSHDSTDDSVEDPARRQSLEVDCQSIPHPDHALNILRYEMRLDRQLTRALKLLSYLQDRQPQEQFPEESEPPERLDTPANHPPTIADQP